MRPHVRRTHDASINA